MKLLLAASAVLSVARGAPAVVPRGGYGGYSDLLVDLGYAVYNGTANTTTGINNWLGIRYGASTEGANRWQKPTTPPTDRTIVQATVRGPNCPQGGDTPQAADFNFTGSEDCLFLNVQSPIGADKLPVLVNIHGGGYGQGSASQDATAIINASGNKFVAVIIQYRLAAFGFAASEDIKKKGVPNAGIYDQNFALQWVQKNIHLFGGDSSRVTIQGESAGGGSVMLQSMAFGGSQGTSLFQNGLAESPYLPTQPAYNDAGPAINYLRFAELAGCYSGDTTDVSAADSNGVIFDCLVGKDSETLQAASSNVSQAVIYGQWAFIPVTDGEIIQALPSKQLNGGKVNGARTFVSSNADEGVGFTPQNITTEDAFTDWVHTLFPRLTDSEFQQLMAAYPVGAAPPGQPLYATDGTETPSALNESIFGVGYQQGANNLYGEATFVCPSYFLSNAYQESYHYQYSVVAASHGTDYATYYGPTPENISPEFESLVMSMYGAYIINDNPSLPDCGIPSVEDFPVWVPGPSETQVNLNQTGGTPFETEGPSGIVVEEFQEPGLQLAISTVNAYSWEAGRGARCDFLASIGSDIPM